MSQTYSYTVYLPLATEVEFPIFDVEAPAPQSQKYLFTQYTGQIQSTPYKETALGLGTFVTLKSQISNQQGEVNENIQLLLNFNGEANDNVGDDIPPKGVLSFNLSVLNPPDEPIVEDFIYKGIITTELNNGAYFGVIGTVNLHRYADETNPAKVVITYKNWL